MAGLDAASTSDVTAFVRAFRQDDGAVAVACRFWLPASSLEAAASKRSEEDRLRLKQWADEGWISLTEGDTTDYDRVEADILEELAACELRRLSFDRWNVTQLVTHLQDALGAERVVAFPQTLSAMTAPTRELERLVKEGLLRTGGNPVLRWMASNVALQYGPNEQVKPDKMKSGEKIDGIVALVMALDGWMRQASEGQSVYDQRAAGGQEVIEAW
jgi:phage terminase large subunit-like protein